MTTRTHNEFLDIAASDDETNDRGYDSEAKVAESKGRAVKRRRTADTQDFFGVESDEDDHSDNDSEQEEIRGKGKSRKQAKTSKQATDEDDENEAEEDSNDDEADQDSAFLEAAAKIARTKALQPTERKAKSINGKPPKKNKTGVIYLSSLPPYLKPFALKAMLEQRGFEPITKIFLAPLLPSAAGNRRKSNKRKTYTDGWVEFASKKTAKICAETLNAHIVGGRKGGWYHDDVWNMKYLRGFKWTDLMEQVQRERSEREARQRIEDSRAKKEEKMFVAGVESGRVADGMARKNEEKARRRLEGEGKNADGEKEKEVLQKKIAQPVRRRFQQSEVVQGSRDGAVADDAKRVLGKIF
jgi:ESF2/ABP1 family protein